MGVTFHVLGSVRECELESWWTSEFSKRDCKGQNPLDHKIPFIVEKRSWNIDVQNGITWPIWVIKTQVMAKKKVENQIGNLTLDH